MRHEGSIVGVALRGHPLFSRLHFLSTQLNRNEWGGHGVPPLQCTGKVADDRQTEACRTSTFLELADGSSVKPANYWFLSAFRFENCKSGVEEIDL
jgi:hypothetical protein